jgi:type IV pilus assembly protein PilX
MTHRRHRRTLRSRERGLALAIALVLLVAITMLGLFSSQGAMLGERIAGNERDRVIALQAAEAALNDAQATIQEKLGVQGAVCETLFNADCDGGFCSTSGTVPADDVWRTRDAKAQPYGTYTSRAAIRINGRAPSQPPRFLIEHFERDAQVRGIRPSGGETRRSLFRVYAWGYGMNPKTTVTLEALFFPPDNFCVDM